MGPGLDLKPGWVQVEGDKYNLLSQTGQHLRVETHSQLRIHGSGMGNENGTEGFERD